MSTRVHVIAVLLMVALSACGTTTYVDSSVSDPSSANVLGWHAVDPVQVTLPRDVPVLEGADRLVEDSRPVIVNVWASYCAPCKEELPMLEKVSRAGQIRVVGLSRDVRRTAAARALRAADVSYENWMDADATFMVALDGRLPLGQIPSSALLVDGRVVAVHLGEFKNRAEVLAGLRFARRD